MQPVERRKFIRKKIRLRAALVLPSGMVVYGNTRDISLEGVFMESTSFSGGPASSLSMGDAGVLTLWFRLGGREDFIKIRCQLLHVSASGAGFSIRHSELNAKDQNKLGRLIAAGRAEIEDD